MTLYNPPVQRRDALLPAGAIGQTFPRFMNATATLAITAGAQRLAALDLPSGATVSSITWLATSTVADAITHCWSALYDQNRNLLGQSVDDTSGAVWATGTARTFTLATPVRLSYSGLYYVGIAQTATTRTTLQCLTTTASLVFGIAPVLAGGADTGLVGTAPSVAGTPGSSATLPYVYVS